jgi:DNA polymerase III sliding clamp (beta) subunit (PCNA family)
MEIQKDQLKSALNLLKPGLSKKDIITNSNCFVFNKGYISSFNDELWFNYPVEGITEYFAVESDEILELLDKTKTDKVTIEVTDDYLLLHAGKANAGFKLVQVDFPVDVAMFDNVEWQELPDDFQMAIKFAAMSASDDLTNPILNCVSIKPDGTVSGTNNFRLSNWVLKSELPIEDTLIPADSVLKILTIKPTSFVTDNDWVHFKNDEGVIASCRVVYETFPDVSKALSKVKGGELIMFPDDIIDILKRAEVFTDDEKIAQTITITRKRNYLIIDSESDAKGFFKERIVMDSESADFSFMINPLFLKDILKQSKKCMLQTESYLISFHGDNWVYMARLINQ